VARRYPCGGRAHEARCVGIHIDGLSREITMRLVMLSALLFVMASSAGARDFEAGQVWSYYARPGDEESLILIDLVEEVPKLGVVFHISVLRVHLPSLKDASRPRTDLPHFPVLKASLEESVVALVAKDHPPLDGYRRGYETWRRAFDAGKAGAFTIPVSEIVQTIEDAIAKNFPKAERQTAQ
jgi:hypothetical protein